MKFNEFKKQTELIFNEYFKNSRITTRFVNCLGKSIFIDAILESQEEDCINGYKENDIIDFNLMIILNDNFNVDSDELNNINVFDSNISYKHLKPVNKPYLYCERKKIKFLNKNYSYDNFIKSYKKSIKKLYDSIYDDVLNNNFIDVEKYDVRKGIYVDSPQKRVLKKLNLNL